MSSPQHAPNRPLETDRPWSSQFATVALATLTQVAQDHRPITEAARMLASSLESGGVIQAFGTGHSQATAMELAGRAGGLIPTNRICLADLAVFGDEPVESLRDVLLERTVGLAKRLFDLAAPEPNDIFVIISNSGINPTIVEMAIVARSHGHRVIAITSATASLSLTSRHESGTRLLDHADVVLDNRAPEGDSMLQAGSGQKICAISSLTGALLIQMMVAEAVQLLISRGIEVPSYVSANVEGGHERNLTIESQYVGRLRRSAL